MRLIQELFSIWARTLFAIAIGWLLGLFEIREALTGRRWAREAARRRLL
jgi:hypothetical protein